MENSNTERCFDNEFTRIWINDGILFTSYTPNLRITLAIAKKCIAERLEFTKDECLPMLCDIRNLSEIDSEARAYMSKGDGIKNLTAGAFIVNTRIEKFLYNSFFTLNQPPVPGRMFTNTEEAIEWLQKHKHFQ